MKKNNRVTAVLISLIVVMSLALTACGGGEPSEKGGNDLDKAIKEEAEYMLEKVPQPDTAYVGGDWLVKGIMESGIEVPEDYYDVYYDNVRALVKSKDGILSERRFSEYARVDIILKTIGKDPSDVEGYNLLEPLDDYDMVTNQGVNAVGYVLTAANVNGYALENEEGYIKYVVDTINAGTYNLGEDIYGDDYIAMGLMGLSFYADREDVKAAIDEGINAILEYQKEDGSFGNCESTCECIAALAQLGVDVTTDERFNRDGKTPLDGLFEYRHEDGGYRHELEDEEADLMASERALTALNAIKLRKDGKPLYKGTL